MIDDGKIDLDDDKYVLCPHCRSIYTHTESVTCLTGQDGEAPYYGIEITQCVHGKNRYGVDGHSLTATACGMPDGDFDTSNRTREIDTFIKMWCEECHKSFGIQFTFHKGNTALKVVSISAVAKELISHINARAILKPHP